MAQTIYRLEVIREFKTKEAAVKAAQRQERQGGRTITVFKEQRTDTGQAFHRETIWQDEEQLKNKIQAMRKESFR